MSTKPYKQLQDELEVVIQSFEQSEHEDVDALLKDYEKGTALIAALENHLKKAEITLNKIKNHS